MKSRERETPNGSYIKAKSLVLLFAAKGSDKVTSKERSSPREVGGKRS